jgi:hypothetical protein
MRGVKEDRRVDHSEIEFEMGVRREGGGVN